MTTRYKSFTPHQAGILFEKVQSEVQLVAEAVDSLRGQVKGDIHSATKGLKEEIRQEIHEEMLMMKYDLQGQILEFKKEFQGQMLEMRSELGGLGGKIDRIGNRLDRHDGEISRLKKAQNLN